MITELQRQKRACARHKREVEELLELLRKAAPKVAKGWERERAKRRKNEKAVDRMMTAEEWNNAHPVNTLVDCYPLIEPRRGEPVRTRTRSRAWTLGDGTAVVRVFGKVGGQVLDCLEVVK